MINMNLYNPKYYAARNDSLTAAVRHNNIEPFKKFIMEYFPALFPDGFRDYTVNYAARLICINVITMPMHDKELAAEWLKNTIIDKEYVDEIAYISEIQKNTKI